MKLKNGRWDEEESFAFHITCKDKLREIIEEDKVDDIENLPINPKLVFHEPNDGGLVKNEEFMLAMYNNWKKMADKYLSGYSKEEGEKLKNRVDKAFMMILAVYRNDSAYFERLGGMITFLTSNLEEVKKVKNIEQEKSAVIEGLHRWWKANDKRLRTKLWIDTSFKMMIKKYKTDMFYRRSINMALIFIAMNGDKWQDDPIFNPKNWFPYKRGKMCNALFGWRF